MLVSRDGAILPLPASRKVRALIGYLALTPQGATRAHLCELLWDVPNDPRGELRWCLSKIRRVLDESGRRRVKTQGDTVTLDLGDCAVDAIEVGTALQAGIGPLPAARLETLASAFAGDFLDGLDLDRSPLFDGWLIAQRRRFRAGHVAILEHLVELMPRDGDAILARLEKWLELAPFDPRAHEAMLDALARRNRLHEGEEHLEATARAFESEGYDAAPLREAWRAAKRRHARAAPSPVIAIAERLPDADLSAAPAGSRRASIALMPFVDRSSGSDGRSRLADGLAHDIITRLAKLRTLFVIAQGTVFTLGERGVGAEEAGRTLNVDYIASGTVQRQKGRITVSVELTETRTARIVWAEVFDEALDNAFQVLDTIGDRIVASIAGEIEVAERNRAILKPPSSLDAWEAYHRGLWHMYRYNPDDNATARHFLEMAVRLDPTFARAYAALSFTHFQNAFQRWTERDPEIERAFETAGQGLIVDDRDPAAHWAMGRAFWLRGRHDEALVELGRAVDLSPSFAHGHYTLSFVHSQSGDPRAAIGASDHSRRLSPFDPLLFAMLATRAIALVRLGRFEEAAGWAVKSADRPNAFSHIRAIAACCLALAGRPEEAKAYTALIGKSVPNYRVEDLLATFQFSPEAVEHFRRGARLAGIG